jgi:hypothetical protein
MTWIRSPSWDGIWILSGLPIGLAMLAIPIGIDITAFFVINTAHLISPMVVAWTNHEFRQVMIRRWTKYILIPTCVLVGAAIIGATVAKTFQVNPRTLAVRVDGWSDYERPFVLMLVLYFLWNAYHFGMQNFGVVSFYRRMQRSRKLRSVDKWSCLIATAVGMIIIPKLLHVPQLSLFVFGFFMWNHSLTAIGVSSHVLGNHHARSPWLFASALIIAGAIGFWLMFCAPGFALRVTMTAIGLRVGLGFVHFLYDRWVYKLSDAKVRSTIGRNFFCRETGRRLGV